MGNIDSPVFCAIDQGDLAAAEALTRQIAPHVGGVKLGLEFFCAQGPGGIHRLTESVGLPLFLDLKLHDIPNTVAGAVTAVVPMQPAFLTLHAAGGQTMLRAAVQAAQITADASGYPRPRLLAVTVLTSLDREDLAAVGQTPDPAAQAERLALLAQDSGVDGVVCSPHEVARLRDRCGPDFVLMVPGVRPRWAATGDQKRVLTPAEAMAAGADHLVIGRPITAAANPADAAQRVAAEIVAARS